VRSMMACRSGDHCTSCTVSRLTMCADRDARDVDRDSGGERTYEVGARGDCQVRGEAPPRAVGITMPAQALSGRWARQPTVRHASPAMTKRRSSGATLSRRCSRATLWEGARGGGGVALMMDRMGPPTLGFLCKSLFVPYFRVLLLEIF
jgi:hypothetical protein